MIKGDPQRLKYDQSVSEYILQECLVHFFEIRGSTELKGLMACCAHLTKQGPFDFGSMAKIAELYCVLYAKVPNTKLPPTNMKNVLTNLCLQYAWVKPGDGKSVTEHVQMLYDQILVVNVKFRDLHKQFLEGHHPPNWRHTTEQVKKIMLKTTDLIRLDSVCTSSVSMEQLRSGAARISRAPSSIEDRQQEESSSSANMDASPPQELLTDGSQEVAHSDDATCPLLKRIHRESQKALFRTTSPSPLSASSGCGSPAVCFDADGFVNSITGMLAPHERRELRDVMETSPITVKKPTAKDAKARRARAKGQAKGKGKGKGKGKAKQKNKSKAKPTVSTDDRGTGVVAAADGQRPGKGTTRKGKTGKGKMGKGEIGKAKVVKGNKGKGRGKGQSSPKGKGKNPGKGWGRGPNKRPRSSLEAGEPEAKKHDEEQEHRIETHPGVAASAGDHAGDALTPVQKMKTLKFWSGAKPRNAKRKFVNTRKCSYSRGYKAVEKFAKGHQIESPVWKPEAQKCGKAYLVHEGFDPAIDLE
jgi:hypothetical protein